MPVRRWIWGVWLLVLLCYLVPYGWLGQVHAWYGSFLFWSVVGILVIVANVLITRDFGEPDLGEPDLGERDLGEMPDDRNGEEEA